MPVTLTIGDELAAELGPYASELPEVIALGIRELKARGDNGYTGLGSVLEKLAGLPAPEEVLALRPSPPLQERIEALLERNRTVGLSPSEQREWNGFEYVEHLVRMAKTSAVRKLGATGSGKASTARRTSHRSSAGKKLYAKRDAKGRFKDIQTFERAHRADLKHKSKAGFASTKRAKGTSARKKS